MSWAKELVDLIPLVAVVALAVWREYENKRYIEQLMDRLMSRNLSEFKRSSTKVHRLHPRRIAALTDDEMAELEENKVNAES